MEEPAQFIYLLKYLLNAYYMPGIVLDTEDTRVYKNVLKKTKKKSPLMQPYIKEEQTTNLLSKEYGKLQK